MISDIPDSLDAGPASEGNSRKAASTERMCALTRAVLPVGALLRFVAAPDGRVVADIRNRLPGRGVWVSARAEAIREAVKKRVFARGLKENVTLPDDFAGEVTRLLAQDALQMLAIANKAGVVVTGFEKIADGRWPITVLIQAADGSPAERRRLLGLCRGRGGNGRDPRVISAFSAHDLALSMGRESVIHAALKVHPVSKSFVERAGRYVEFLAVGPAESASDPAPGPSGIEEHSST